MVQQPDEVASARPALTLFYCYARKDKALRDEIDVHLAALHRSRLVTSWHDAMIIPGADWEHEIDTHLNAASIILLLVSPDFLNSDYCYSREMQRAIERHARGEAHVIPILLRPVDWEDTPFSTLQMLPADAKPVTQWSDRDAAFADIARGIRRVVNVVIAQQRVQAEEQQRRREEEQKRLQVETLLERGKALNVQKRYTEALPLFARAIQLAPRSSDAWGHLGRTLGFLDRPQEALDACDHALALDSTFVLGWINKGAALSDLKRYEEALNAYDHALSLNPSETDAWNNKGLALSNLQRYEEALDAYDHAFSLNPNETDAWNNKGTALWGLQRYQEAIDAYDHALALDPTYAIAWSNKAITLRQLGRTKEADAADQRARQLRGS